jgi:hypothetical protein
MNMSDKELNPGDEEIHANNVTDEVLRIVAGLDDKSGQRALLDAAKDPSSPLHDCFTWEDGVAAERYRLAQAGMLYRRVKLSIVRLDAEQREVKFETIRAIVSVPGDRTKKNSKSHGRISVVMSDDKRRESVLRGIVRDLVALRNKYAKYAEFQDVWVVIDDAADVYDPSSAKKKGDRKSAPPPAA